MSRKIEVTVGLFAAAFGLVGLGLAIFGPATYSYGTDWMTRASVSLWDQGVDTWPVLLYLAVMMVAALGVGIGAFLHSQEVGAGALVVRWTSALVLLGGALLTIPGSTTAVVPSELHTSTADSVGIGIYLILPALAALAAATVSTAMQHERGGTLTLHPR